jgi:CheY-like chemotaxis protein
MEDKILIVEDNYDSREYLAQLLRVKGYKVDTAEDGVEGIEKAIVNHPDFIISDINTPNLDGIQMVKALRRIPECSAIPILVVSAYGSGILADASIAGANQVMRKPLDLKLLFMMIEKHLSKRESSH